MERWARDWEFCFRAGEMLLHHIIDEGEVRGRREGHFKRKLLAGSGVEAARFSPEVAGHARWLAQRWCVLFDDWSKDPERHVFPDGYALLFFLCGLYANVNAVLRGQVDASWRVATSLSRWRATKGEEATAQARAAADNFIARISELDLLKHQYPSGLRAEHREAICQHYGFPTEYLDVTFAYDVALFFAEDWKQRGREPMPERGAIYGVPLYAVARHSSLVTLPPAVLRPTLQFGKFLRGDSDGALELLERHKFTYRHAASPVARGISQMGFDTPPRLEHYLYPPSDPLEQIARELRSW